MMPLTVAPHDKEVTIVKVGGGEKTRSHLENLGFVQGGKVTVVSENGGNLIVKLMESRVAISKELALKIMV